MKPTKRHLTLPAIAVTALVVAACGGGGGSGITTTTPTAVSLTTTNAKVVSAEILNSSETVQGTTVGPTILTGVSVSASKSDFNYPAFVVQQLTKVQALGGGPSTTLNGVIPTTNVTCYTNGMANGDWTLSGNDPDNSNDVTAGDTVNISYNNCVEDGVSVNGSISMTITQLTGDLTTPPYTLGVDATLTTLSVIAGGHSATSSGEITMLIEEDGSNNETYELSGSSLSSSVAGKTVTLTNYSYEFLLNESTGAYSYRLQGTLANAAIGGSVTYTTITPFTGTDPDDPTAGELHITGADGSQAWVTADSGGTTVYIDVDADGDDTAETQITTDWTELANL
jgi:hypothetical protein